MTGLKRAHFLKHNPFTKFCSVSNKVACVSLAINRGNTIDKDLKLFLPLFYTCMQRHDDLVAVYIASISKNDKSTIDGQRFHYEWMLIEPLVEATYIAPTDLMIDNNLSKVLLF